METSGARRVGAVPACVHLADCANCNLGIGDSFGAVVPGCAADATEKTKIMFVGEAPGREEVGQGRPFVGQSGRLLRAVVGAHDMLATAYFTNACICRPPNNRTPYVKELRACWPRLKAEILAVDPEVIVAVGVPALKTLTGLALKGQKTKDYLGRTYKFDAGEKEYPVVFLHHPAWILLNTAFAPLWHQLLKLQVGLVYDPVTLPTVSATDITDADNAVACLNALTGHVVCIDLETSDLKTRTCKILCIALAYRTDQGIRASIIDGAVLTNPTVIAALQHFIQNTKVIGQNLPFDSLVLANTFGEEFFLTPLLDTLFAAQSVFPRTGGHNLETLLLVHLGYPNYKAEFRELSGGNYDDPEIRPQLVEYAARDAAFTLELAEHYYTKLLDKSHYVACHIMNIIMDTTQRIELRGARIDIEHAEHLKTTWLAEATQLQEEIAELSSGDITKPSSPLQVRNHLYDTLKLPVTKKTGTGLPSTDKEAMEAINENDVPVAAKLRMYRSKMNDVNDHLHGVTSRVWEHPDGYWVHNPHFNVTGTVTGRLSSSEPNNQNFPKHCRPMFVPRPGFTLVEADYAQLEVRVGLVLAGDAEGLEMAQSSTSIHKQVSTRIYGPDYDDRQYTRCKSVVFAIMYGGDKPKKIAHTLDITKTEAKEIIRLVHGAVAGYIQWRARVRQAVREGLPPYVTPFGRHRDFPIITKVNADGVMNECINFPVQSTASDICQLKVNIALHRLGWTAINTTHDSVLVEVPTDDVHSYVPQLREILESPVMLMGQDVCFPVDIQTGYRWGELKDFGG